MITSRSADHFWFERQLARRGEETPEREVIWRQTRLALKLQRGKQRERCARIAPDTAATRMPRALMHHKRLMMYDLDSQRPPLKQGGQLTRHGEAALWLQQGDWLPLQPGGSCCPPNYLVTDEVFDQSFFATGGFADGPDISRRDGGHTQQ